MEGHGNRLEVYWEAMCRAQSHSVSHQCERKCPGLEAQIQLGSILSQPKNGDLGSTPGEPEAAIADRRNAIRRRPNQA